MGGIDGGIFIGRDETTGTEISLDRQLEILSAMGADRAIATAFRSVWFDYREGNAQVLRLAQSNPKVIPAAVINLAGFDPFDGYFESLRGQGFAAAVLVSGVMGLSLQSSSARALGRAAAGAGLPIILCIRSSADYSAAADFIAPSGATVLVRWMRGGGYFNVTDMLAVARDCPNFLFDAGVVTQSGGIEHLVDRLGDERWFLASNLPLSHAGCAYFMLAAADLPSSSRDKIAGGNLAKALRLLGKHSFRQPQDFERLKQAEKIDTHWHTSGWNVIETKTGFDDLSKLAKNYNCRAVITSSIRALSDDLETGNEETRTFLDREPRARGLVVVNPRRVPESIAALDRYKNDPRFIGVKTIQDFYDLRLDSDLYKPILDKLRTMRGWPFMAHLPGLKEAAEQNPDLSFIAAHSTWRHREIEDLPNVWFDIASSTPIVSESDVADLVKRAPDRVIFSADAPLLDPAWTLGKLASINLSEKQLEMIFLRNAARAFPRLNAS